MSSNDLYKGMIIGAVVGTGLALLDKTTRSKTSGQLKVAGKSLNYYKTRPSEAVRDFRMYYESLSGDITKKAEDVMDILSQVQETMDMVNGMVQKNQGDSSEQSPSHKE